MATFFSLILLLLLLSLSAVDLFLHANAAPLDDICRQTKETSRCVSLLTSFDTRSPTATLPVLEQIAIDTTSYTSGQTKIQVHNLLVFETDPKLKTIYTNCENLYLDALDALNIAPQYLQKHSYDKLIQAAGTVGRAVNGCTVAVSNKAGLKKNNDDVGVVAEAMAVIARNLH